MEKKPILIYDGDCNFCRRWIARWRILTEDRIEYEPSQKVADDYPQIPKEKFMASVQMVESDGQIFGGAEAVFRTLTYAQRKSWLFWLYKNLPGFSFVSERFYSFVARQRVFFSGLTNIFWGNHLEPSTYFLSRRLFLRLLALIYLAAFISLGIQMMGLAGSHGILPAQDFLQAVSQQFGSEKYHWLPTLCWFNASDKFLKFLCWGGAGLSFLLLLDFASAPILFLLWLFYLSLSSVCQDFLWFQWDTLLLETGFLAIFLAPLKILPKWSEESPPSSTILWLLRWLLFRLMFESGCVKLLSGDAAWRNLTALSFHYQTQPLPTWMGWYAHQLPAWFQKMSAASMFAIEFVVPFLIFSPRRARLCAFVLLNFLQIMIALTGNYCFFNWLTIALSFVLLDDAYLQKVFPKGLAERFFYARVRSRSGGWKKSLVAALGAMIFFVSGIQLTAMFLQRANLPRAFEQMLSWAAPFRTINSYGLFAVMTTSRPEIIVEGSNDRKEWSAYEFKWKPGDLKRKPAFVAPHQPRLDWQMWFAALSSYQNNPWFINFLVRLLQGSPEVLALLEKNPFPDRPPQYVRALVYEYSFTDLATKRREGNWWKREFKGLYCPVISLQRN